MSNPNLVKNDYSSKRYYFKNFASKEDLDEKGKAAFEDELRNNPRGTTAREYSRSDTPGSFEGSYDKALLDGGQFLDYIEKDTLFSSMESFDEILANIDMGGAFKKQRLIITDDSRGIFDFGLASLGLYREVEYFSEELKNESPLEFMNEISGIVPPILTQQNQLDQFIYFSQALNKTFVLERRQKGTTEMLSLNPTAELVKDETGLIFTEPATFGDFALTFSTKNKKSYLMFEKKGGKAKMVDLYVGIGGLQGLTYEGMLARAMPLLLAARYFESVGIRTRINATRMYERSEGNGSVVCFTYPIKDYGQDVDFNWIAINTADPRWFRWNLWRYTSALLKKEFDADNPGNGSTVYSGDLLYETFNRYKNWYFKRIEKGEEEPIRINKNLMIIGGLPSPRNSLTGQKTEIIDEFHRILDVVDFQFNKPEKCAERIYKRMVIDERKSKETFKSYVQKTLATAYSYPTRGQDATPSEEQDKLDEDYDKAIEGLNNYLQTL
jgi:hypothetical protein